MQQAQLVLALTQFLVFAVGSVHQVSGELSDAGNPEFLIHADFFLRLTKKLPQLQ